MHSISSFRGENFFLSNFYPCKIKHAGLVFPCVECAFVASKTFNVIHKKEISKMTASQAKKFGHTVKLRPYWDQVKLSIMTELLEQKFSKKRLEGMLLLTGTSILIEGNNWGDTYWGVCNGQGRNNLGRILMSIRDRLHH